METEELDRKRQILKNLRARKHERDVQAARFGVSADPVVNTERTELAQQIAELEQAISEAEHNVYVKSQFSSIKKRCDFNYSKISTYLLVTSMFITAFAIYFYSNSISRALMNSSINDIPSSGTSSSPDALPSQEGYLGLGDIFKDKDLYITLVNISSASDVVTIKWRIRNASTINARLPENFYGLVETGIAG